MTCIVGLVDDGKVWVGGDSQGTRGWDFTVRADEKVFLNDGYIMGTTGSFRMSQLLRYGFTPPQPDPGADLMRHMVTMFIDAVRECLSAGGWSEKKDERERGGEFLVGYRGRLFRVEGDFQVGESLFPYNAAGCGAHFAKAVMWSTDGLPPEERVRMALECAETFSAGVSGPFHIVSVE